MPRKLANVSAAVRRFRSPVVPIAFLGVVLASGSAFAETDFSRFDGLSLVVSPACKGCRTNIVFSSGRMLWSGGSFPPISYAVGTNHLPGNIAQTVKVTGDAISFSGVGPTTVLTIGPRSCTLSGSSCRIVASPRRAVVPPEGFGPDPTLPCVYLNKVQDKAWGSSQFKLRVFNGCDYPISTDIQFVSPDDGAVQTRSTGRIMPKQRGSAIALHNFQVNGSSRRP
ncbi:hypothetical protein [Methylobacterium oxalidis]|uniref:hypothetical protein n=1 Tax=Methylobacterium oxalidis TaxID=944322 RepID=UPI0011BDD593|nr:hypothetical protein [Methylobacterium oxalidis]GJE34605.1 hypothetical protein LDDCCGHA_4817 [Methylobacterium oxalidis]